MTIVTFNGDITVVERGATIPASDTLTFRSKEIHGDSVPLDMLQDGVEVP